MYLVLLTIFHSAAPGMESALIKYSRRTLARCNNFNLLVKVNLFAPYTSVAQVNEMVNKPSAWRHQ
jgi:hypothetical protein